MTDSELLRRYGESRSEAAFTELVSRHLSLVYHSALRQVGGDEHRAKDIAQGVFTDLARKAGRLADHPMIEGWLYKSTRFAAAQSMRTEKRRQKREQEAHAMHEISSESEPAGWEQLRPVIDDVLHALDERDRQAIFLRFFSGTAFAEIGARWGTTADAARFRVDRGLEKMRRELSKRGVTSTAAALGATLAAQACPAVPSAMASSITGAVFAGASAPGAATLVQLMATYKQIGLIAALVAVGATVATTEWHKQRAFRREIAEFGQQDQAASELRAENRRLQRLRANLSAQALDDARDSNPGDPHSLTKKESADAARGVWAKGSGAAGLAKPSPANANGEFLAHTHRPDLACLSGRSERKRFVHDGDRGLPRRQHRHRPECVCRKTGRCAVFECRPVAAG